MTPRAITFRLPEDLHERLRLEAFEQRRTMNEIATEAISARYVLLDNGGSIAHVDSDPSNNEPVNLLVWGQPR